MHHFVLSCHPPLRFMRPHQSQSGGASPLFTLRGHAKACMDAEVAQHPHPVLHPELMRLRVQTNRFMRVVMCDLLAERSARGNAGADVTAQWATVPRIAMPLAPCSRIAFTPEPPGVLMEFSSYGNGGEEPREQVDFGFVIHQKEVSEVVRTGALVPLPPHYQLMTCISMAVLGIFDNWVGL